MRAIAIGAITPLLVSDSSRVSADQKPDSRTQVIRDSVHQWLPKVFKDPGEVDPAAQYGEAVLPVLEDILSEPERLTPNQSRRALFLVRVVDRPYPSMRVVLVPYLQATQSSTRRAAVEALAAVGAKRDVPAMVAMLSDYDLSVRYHAAQAIGALGDESALLALDIWLKQTARADRSRDPGETWLSAPMIQVVDEARVAIKQRIGSRR